MLLCAPRHVSELERHPQSSLTTVLDFVREHWLRVAVVSLFLSIPCLWHEHIEAGDLDSHVYNAWLAQLTARGRAPGLYLAKRWSNILVDLALLKIGNLLGFAAAEKIVVLLWVLIFFWGAFALIAAVTARAPWSLLPCLVMLSYGWTFNAGFLNYYVSLGLGFLVIAIAWRVLETCESNILNQGRAEIMVSLVLAALVWIAHPQGFLWLLCCVVYVSLWKKLHGWKKLRLPVIAVLLIAGVRVFCASRYEIVGVWQSFGPGIYNGSDQIALYGRRYLVLSLVALFFGVACFADDSIRRFHTREGWKPLRLPLELYGLMVFGTYVLPDVLRIPLYAGWIGAFAVRLTTISAVLGLCVLGLLQPKRWHWLGFGAVSVVFFTFLYQDTGVLNRMELQIKAFVSSLPNGARVTATIRPPADSRLRFIVHMADRACVGKCFSYQDYEPASGEFLLGVRKGSPVVTDDPASSRQMEAGEYVVKPEDLPMWQIYQCDPKDMTRLGLRPLAAGEVNGRLGSPPRN
jgi:hypothetical protein